MENQWLSMIDVNNRGVGSGRENKRKENVPLPPKIRIFIDGWVNKGGNIEEWSS